MKDEEKTPWDTGYTAYESGDSPEYAAIAVPYDSAEDEEAYSSWWEGWHQAQREYLNVPLSYGEFEEELIDQSSVRYPDRLGECLLPCEPGEDLKSYIRRTYKDPTCWTRQNAERIGKQAFEKTRENWLSEEQKRRQED